MRAIACLANADEGTAVSADLLADQTKVPRRYLTRILQDLCEAGLVGSKSGPKGGYELVMPHAQVTILEVVNSVDPIERSSLPPGA